MKNLTYYIFLLMIMSCLLMSFTLKAATVHFSDPPTAADDVAFTGEDTTVIINVLNNDGFVNEEFRIDTASVAITTAPLYGSAAVVAGGRISYTPAMDFVGAETMGYTVCFVDTLDVSYCDIVEIFIQVSPVNDEPIAQPDCMETVQNTPVVIDLVANDFDVDDGILNPCEVNFLTSPANGVAYIGAAPGCLVTYEPDPSFIGIESFLYEVCDSEGACGSAVVTISVGMGAFIDLQLSVLLEGAYNETTGEMNTFLNLSPDGDEFYRGILPGQKKYADPLFGATAPNQPYNIAPWNYAGNEGTYDLPPWYYAPGSKDPQFAVYHPDVVDWVLVRIRRGSNPGNATDTEKTAAALLLKDGSVEFFSPCLLARNELFANTVMLQIDHRNHVAVAAPSMIDVSDNQIIWDFTSGDSYNDNGLAFGQKELQPGLWVMCGGDDDQNSDFPSYDINGSDKVAWSYENGIFDDYLPGDMDMSGDVNALDKLLWNKNNGTFSKVPK